MSVTKTGCPGQNTAYLKDFNTNIVQCTKCGRDIEFFSDERKVKCPKCHTNVFKVKPQIIDYRKGEVVFYESEKSCLDWCGACLDKKDYADILKNNERIESKKEDLKRLISSIEKKDKEAVEFLIDAFRKSINYSKLFDPKVFDILQKTKPDLFKRIRSYYTNFLDNPAP
ncbi:MAG: zinc ribbon domain-containing protein [Actinobacteria bacterium]|nr:zinc ribbon domain-containing protein [Actinomycetota bacterium]MBM3712511.1 zinc ribbon domain-containing protein [Actinomycetota bacterium]